MRFLWLVALFFPSLAFSIYGCPEGYNSGMVTMATNLPICVKYDGSQLGGCEVNCKGVCVQYPLKDSQGPVYTTGNACKPSDGGGGGNPDPENPDPEKPDPEGGGGGKPVPEWSFFEAPTGDATGTSISASIAKLNRNLGLTVGSGLNGMTYNRVNEIKGDTNRIVKSSERAKDLLQEISDFNRAANSKLEGLELIASRSEGYLEQIAKKGGGGSSGGSSPFDESMARALVQNSYSINSNTASIHNSLSPLSGQLGGIMNMQGEIIRSINGVGGNISSALNGMSNNRPWGGREFSMLMDKLDGLGGAGGGGGKGVDYSKMPGSDKNPLSVKRGQYNSKCKSGDCFFDVSGIKKELDKANKSLSDKHGDIAKEVKDIFSFNLSGSSEVMDCFDLFSYGGKVYQVCPPSQDYWQTLAALMMFIFYFIALMVIFKR